MSGDGSEPLCPFLLANPPTCDRTYAENIGPTFDYFQGGYVAYALALLIPAVVLTTRIVKQRGGFRPFDSQKKMFFIVNVVVATLVVRSIDPFGWRKVLPIVLVQLMIDWGTAAIYSAAFIMIHDWLRVVLKVTGNMAAIPRVKVAINSFHVIQWSFFTIFAVLQQTKNDQWRWRAYKLICAAGMMLAMLIMETVCGGYIWFILRRNVVQSGGPAAAASTEDVSNSRASLSRPQATQKQTNDARREKINRILKLLLLAFVVEVAVIVVQLSTVRELLDKRFTRDRPDKPPKAGDIVLEASFDFLQGLGTVIMMYFFRANISQKSEGDSHSESSRSRGSSRFLNNAPPPKQKHWGQAAVSTLPLARTASLANEDDAMLPNTAPHEPGTTVV